MKKNITSFISLILATLMLTSILSIAASAVVLTDPLTFTVGSVSGKPGDKVKVPISITGNPSLWSFRFIIYYEPAIQITDIIVGDTFDTDEILYSNPNTYLPYLDAITYLFKEANIKTDGYNGLVCTLQDNNLNNNEGNGIIITLEMQIPDNLPNGSYTLNILNDDESSINLDGDYNPNSFSSITANPGTITISGSSADKMPETTAPDKATEAPSASTQAGSSAPQTQIVYAPVTDASGNVVTDADGNTVTTALQVLVSDETDAAGNQVTATADNESDNSSSTAEVKANGAQNDISNIKKTMLFVVIGVVVLLLIGAAIAYVIINRKSVKKRERSEFHTSRMSPEEIEALRNEKQNSNEAATDATSTDENTDDSNKPE